MSRFPDFTTLPFEDGGAAPATAAEQAWDTAEGLRLKSRYDATDRAGLDFVDGLPGLAPFLRGPYPTMYLTNPWTHPPIRGDSPRLRTPTPSTAAIWRPARWASRSLSISPPTGATTAIIRE